MPTLLQKLGTLQIRLFLYSGIPKNSDFILSIFPWGKKIIDKVLELLLINAQ